MSSRLSAPAAGSRRGARLRAANPAASPSAGAHEGWEPPLRTCAAAASTRAPDTEHRLLQPAPVPAPRPAAAACDLACGSRRPVERGVRTRPPVRGQQERSPGDRRGGRGGSADPRSRGGARGAADGAARGGRHYSPRISRSDTSERGPGAGGAPRGVARHAAAGERGEGDRPRAPDICCASARPAARGRAGAVSGERARAARHAAGSESILPAKPAEAALADASPAGRARTGLPLARERGPVRPPRAGDGGASPGARGHSLPSPGRCCPGARPQAALHHRGDVRPAVGVPPAGGEATGARGARRGERAGLRRRARGEVTGARPGTAAAVTRGAHAGRAAFPPGRRPGRRRAASRHPAADPGAAGQRGRAPWRTRA